MKKWLRLLLCLVLVLTLALPAFATEETGESADHSETTGESSDPGEDSSEGSGDTVEGPGNSGDSSGNTDEDSDDSGDVPSDSEEGSDNSVGSTEAPHTHTWVTVVVPSTCTEEGGTVIMCSVCETVDSVALSPLAPHTYDNTCDPDCNVCQASREVTHKFSTSWNRNSRKHWHECSICGVRDGESDHYPGPAATEEQDQFCLTCGLLMTPRKGHTHVYDTVRAYDESGHWYACKGCDDQKDHESHVYDNLCDPACSVCGYQSPETAHAYSDAYGSDEDGHWNICALCGKATGVQPHIPAENVPEDQALLCTVCGYALAPAQVQVHVHEFAPEWSKDAQNHWKACVCGEISDNAAHVWNEGVEDQGNVTFRCNICGTVRTEELPAAEFPWGILLTAAVLAVSGGVMLLILLLKFKKGTGKFSK